MKKQIIIRYQTIVNLLKCCAVLIWLTFPLCIQAQNEMLQLPTRQLTIEKLISEIESQSGWIIGVNHRNFNISQTVKFDSDHIPTKEALNRIVEGTEHTYLLRGKHVMIVRKKALPPKTMTKENKEPAKIVPFNFEEGTMTLRPQLLQDTDTIITEYTEIGFETEQNYVFAVQSPGEQNKVWIKDLTIEHKEDSVHIDFAVIAEREAAIGNEAITITPVLRRKEEEAFWEQKLERFGLEGRKFVLSMQRRHKNQRIAWQEEQLIRMYNGDSISYSQTLPATLFLPGTILEFECDAACCRRYERKTVQTAASDFVNHYREVILPEILPTLTTGDRIALDYPFVEKNPERDVSVIRPNRQQALMVYYELDKSNLRYDYRNNNRTLSQMIAAINIIKESTDSEITHVVLSGYASPEGPAERNDRLGGNRVLTLRNFLLKHTGLKENTFIMHNGGSDWEGLKYLITESENAYKNEILQILDEIPVEQRMKKIQMLDKGRAYQLLLDSIFPELRNAAYIKVYYKNK